ncbi:hypothetical protein ABS751_10510 [Bacillus subtilis]|nr:hypothetical protein [Bacillus subtilis]AYK68258.1 hypothetical protein D9C11_23350 [Bacillus subtilis subsp. subtilis]
MKDRVRLIWLLIGVIGLLMWWGIDRPQNLFDLQTNLKGLTFLFSYEWFSTQESIYSVDFANVVFLNLCKCATWLVVLLAIVSIGYEIRDTSKTRKVLKRNKRVIVRETKNNCVIEALSNTEFREHKITDVFQDVNQIVISCSDNSSDNTSFSFLNTEAMAEKTSRGRM